MDLRELPETQRARHPWETARARFFAALLDEHGLVGAGTRVLDVGAGDGYLARTLVAAAPAARHETSRATDVARPSPQPFAQPSQGSSVSQTSIVCFDPHYTDRHLADFARDAGPAIRFTRQRPAERFDLVLALDVIEHVDDDQRLLRELTDDALAPGGAALVSVPAWMSLYTEHDVRLGHRRRYRPADLVHVIEAAGLEVTVHGGLFHGLLVPRALEKLREALDLGATTTAHDTTPPAHGASSAGEGGEGNPVATPCHTGVSGVSAWRHGAGVTAVVGAALAIDNAVSRLLARRGIDLPGLSAWALARKPRPEPVAAGGHA